MGEDFKPGDLCVCINDDTCPVRGGEHGYRKNRIYRVAVVKTGRDDFGRLVTGLKAVGLEHELYRNVVCFRKLPKADEQFTAAMRACKLSRNRVPA